MLKGFLILLVIGIATGMYLIIVGGSKNKSQYEKELEDEEQMEYLLKWRKHNENK